MTSNSPQTEINLTFPLANLQTNTISTFPHNVLHNFQNKSSNYMYTLLIRNDLLNRTACFGIVSVTGSAQFSAIPFLSVFFSNVATSQSSHDFRSVWNGKELSILDSSVIKSIVPYFVNDIAESGLLLLKVEVWRLLVNIWRNVLCVVLCVSSFWSTQLFRFRKDLKPWNALRSLSL